MENHKLRLKWSKAFGELYCWDASLIIPYSNASLFPPEYVRVGVTVRSNDIKKGNVLDHYDRSVVRYLPCLVKDEYIELPLAHPSLIDGLSLDGWTSAKKKGNVLKDFPVSMFYQLPDEDVVTLPFDYENLLTPFLISKPLISNLKDGEKIDVEIILENS